MAERMLDEQGIFGSELDPKTRDRRERLREKGVHIATRPLARPDRRTVRPWSWWRDVFARILS